LSVTAAFAEKDASGKEDGYTTSHDYGVCEQERDDLSHNVCQPQDATEHDGKTQTKNEGMYLLSGESKG
jgi:hypothetical protein